MSRALVAALVAFLPVAALADRGALSLEGGAGVSAPFLPAPYATDAKRLRVTAPSVWLGGRYALSHSLEVVASGFWEPSVTAWHNAANIDSGGSRFPGTLNHSVQRFGAVAGPRLVHGMVWRVSLGLDVGWSQRRYSGFRHIDVSTASPVAYDLELRDFTANNFLLSPVIGLEWAGGDHWSVSLQPRVQLLLGAEATVVFTAPLTFSWSWYL
ncbi:hypothetical protein QEG98_41930 (plasmid) [Myxococcus sp. MxC21-1]|uniref:hypothetical protein n=1 Tax=Myxococcus sp. MxC21-1 TaxID=3041439 RepID=UPI00292CE104|nr:hypothetical protein [Myxococcus sp. MxC21-1]WNZ66229.1 hypothetical protein QEG98_41930 [Myxococcus sp. MxC21-1]